MNIPTLFHCFLQHHSYCSQFFQKFFLLVIIEKSVQIVNDDKYPLTFPRFVDASIDSPPPKPKILYETLLVIDKPHCLGNCSHARLKLNYAQPSGLTDVGVAVTNLQFVY